MTYQQWRDRVLSSEDASYWLKEAIKILDCMDPVDALRDAEFLHNLLKKRWSELSDQ